jgi:hypothetical protein
LKGRGEKHEGPRVRGPFNAVTSLDFVEALPAG